MLDLQAEQHEQGQPCQDLYEAVADLKRRHDLHPCAVRPRDGLSLRRDSERETVQDLVKRFRDLPAEQQRRRPALLNSLAQLEVVVGDLEASQHDFQEVARLVADPLSQAEAHHNVYRAALERRDWDEALAALRRAAALDADQFEPFPFARYEPRRLLGAGGFGATFLCEDREAGRTVVVKSLRTDALDRDPNTLFREMALLHDLDHPAILRVHDCQSAGPDQDRPHVVLEYFEGRTLAEHVALHGPLAPEDWLAICWPIARALQAIHGRGVLHRSLRPAAVLLRREEGMAEEGGQPGKGRWRVKLLDTGLSLKRALIHASASNPAARVQTSLGRSVSRTLAYVPSEVVGRPKGRVWVGPHSDVYGFGRLCAFALTGRPDPDSGDRVALPDEWGQLLDECCAWIIARRPAHFGIVLERLSALPGAGDIIAGLESDLHQQAVTDATAALEADPDRLDALINRASVYLGQGEFAQAIEDLTRAIELQPDDPSLYRRRGLAHARSGEVDQAIADYSEAIRLEPHDVEAHANRGLAHAQKQDYDAAIADYTEAIRLNPRDEALLYNRGNAYYCKGDYGAAIADYTAALRLDPRSLWALGNRGKAHALRGDQARAVADFTRLLQLDPGNVRALTDRSSALAALGRLDRALADCDSALRLAPTADLYVERGLLHARLNDPEKAAADYTEALELEPDNLRARLLRGNVRAEVGQTQEAIADLDEVIRRQAEWAPGYFHRGNVHARVGNHDAALADYTRAIELDATHAGAWFQRGNIHAERGELEEAVRDYSETIRASAERGTPDAAALTNRGNCHARLGDLERALADYDEALRLEPADPLTLCNRAAAHSRAGNIDRAIADYTEAIRFDPASARAHNARGNLHAERGELARAIADFDAAIRLEPDFARPYHNRGNAHAERGELEEAIADFDEAIRLEPGNAAAWYNRGNAHAERGELEEAIADFTEALRLQPNHAGALNNRGNVHHRRGDDEQALADFAAAIAADPNFSMPYCNRARLYNERGDRERALADYSAALRIDPEDVSVYHSRGRLYALLGDHGQAIADNLEAQRLRPNDARAYNNLAWLWATSPDPAFRDPARAVEYARRACELSGWQDAGHLDTLAVAHAALGQFTEAIQRQREAIDLAPEPDKEDFRSRLALYEAGQPYQELAAPPHPTGEQGPPTDPTPSHPEA
jgi:tetratricopeptide (TPR) repeat protein